MPSIVIYFESTVLLKVFKYSNTITYRGLKPSRPLHGKYLKWLSGLNLRLKFN